MKGASIASERLQSLYNSKKVLVGDMIYNAYASQSVYKLDDSLFIDAGSNGLELSNVL